MVEFYSKLLEKWVVVRFETTHDAIQFARKTGGIIK